MDMEKPQTFRMEQGSVWAYSLLLACLTLKQIFEAPSRYPLSVWLLLYLGGLTFLTIALIVKTILTRRRARFDLYSDRIDYTSWLNKKVTIRLDDIADFRFGQWSGYYTILAGDTRMVITSDTQGMTELVGLLRQQVSRRLLVRS